MRGCLLLFVGLVLGALLVVSAQVFLIHPSPQPETAPNRSDVVILFTNHYLTRMLQDYLAQTNAPLPLQGAKVQAEAADRLVLAGDVNVTVNGVAVHAPLRITLHPSVQGNRVVVQVVQAQAGGLNLPGSFFQGFEGPINRQLNQTLQSTPYQVVGVNTTVEGLVVNVVVKK